MTKKDSIIVLSGQLTPGRGLTPELESRVSHGVRMLEQMVSDFIIMNGGPGLLTEPEGCYVPRGTRPVQCEVMRSYVLARGVPDYRILMQDYSSDTIGEAYFVKEMILRPKSWRNNAVVTSKYHEWRATEIYHLILGPNYATEFECVATEFDNNTKILAKEEASLEKFLEEFGDVAPGDSRAIEKILYERHKLYLSIPEEKRLRFYL